ncbi:helix-turn-helix domain-containing protein [Gillisia sp. CAL575]|uniref:helix-turn-helix domain-containing protein n=1 Tax=Gillisia sp. CAL575 TaxID=985255 RepID=UPI0003A3F9AE|nr:helix-turn-helix domain-containing protein [Gillisia sp. CAL575]
MTIIQPTPEQIVELIKSGLESQFKEVITLINSKKANDELLTREETCEFLKIDSSTLWNWTKKGKVKAYGISSRRYYKRSELFESLILKK